MSIRVLLADDHAGFRTGLRQMLESDPELQVVNEAVSGADAVRIAADQHPDIAILDVRMSPLNGIQAIPKILSVSPRTAIVMLSMHADHQYVKRSLEAGAKAYLLKETVGEELLPAIRAVHAGRSYFSVAVAPFGAQREPL